MCQTLAVASALIGSCALANWAVDPFDRLGLNNSGIYSASERTAKPRLIETYRHDGLIVGSSRVTYIDPRDIDGYQLFNAGFSQAMPEEIAEFLRLFAVRQRLVVIGLDFFMFNEREYPPRGPAFADVVPADRTVAPAPTTYKDVHDLRNYLVSRNVLASTVKTMIARARTEGPPPYLEAAGNRNPEEKFTADRSTERMDCTEVVSYWRTHVLYDFRYSDARVSILKDLGKMLEQRQEKYIVFINPEVTCLMDLIKEMGLYPLNLKFRRDVASIFPVMFDLSEGKWSDAKHYFRSDPGHYFPSAGAAMLNRMIGDALSRPR